MIIQEKPVSIVLNTYNRANLLKRSIESVLKQNYNNYELLIVDDCSTDDTEEVVKKCQKRDNRVKYIKHESNFGLAVGRNTGWQNAGGKYIAFLDDDDEWIDPDKLKKQVAILEKNGNSKLKIICTNIQVINENGGIRNKVIYMPKNLKEHFLRQNGIIFPSTVMIDKDIIKRVGGFDTRFPRGIDSDLYRRYIIEHDYGVQILKDITVRYREYGKDRITQSNNVASLNKIILAHKLTLIKYFPYFLRYPRPLLYRLKSILKAKIYIILLKLKRL